MVGYSRLISHDDIGTIQRLRAMRHVLIDPAIHEYGGTIVQTGGDSLLIMFDSIEGAVRCAVKVQQQVPVYDGDQPPERRIRFRVGINTGDAIPEGTDLHGEGVNIAARLQAACPPGGLCVSRAVRDQVGGRLGLAFQPIGSLSLKNIPQPVEAYVVRLDSTPSGAIHRARTALLASTAALLLIATGGTGWFVFRGAVPASVQVSLTPPSATAQKFTPPNVGLSNAPRLSIVVLPFENLSGDPKDDYLAEGITDDLTTDLSNVTRATVIARNSAYTYKGKPINVKQVGEELGVRYVLEGSVRRLGDVLRINAQLVSGETGTHLWADRFDEPMQDLTEGQEEIVKRLGSLLGWEMVQVEAARSARDRPANPDAFDLFLRARSLSYLPYTPEHFTEARKLLERAVQLDPSFAHAKTFLASVLVAIVNNNQAIDGGADEFTRAAALTSEAAIQTPDSWFVLASRAYLLRSLGRWGDALATAQRMMDLYPSNAEAYNQLATMKLAVGRLDEAIPLQKASIRLDPRNTWLFERYENVGYALMLRERPQEALIWFQRALAASPERPGPRSRLFRKMAVAYALDNHADDAKQALAENARLNWFETARSDVQWYGSEAAIAQTRRYLEGLRKAGLRDHADEDADFGVAPDAQLHSALQGRSPTTVPGASTIRTDDLASMIKASNPIILDTLWNFMDVSLPGAVGLLRSGLGGTYTDSTQDRLRSKMADLTKGDMSLPVVVVGWSSERFDGYNLALRIVALGYTKVFWYRGGRETWEAKGLPETNLTPQDW
jgi:TolB-like protein/class 3 adenylate cyclase/Tfp pilus assembly protein PilF